MNDSDNQELVHSQKINKLDIILENLRSMKIAPWIRIFGSAIDKTVGFPADIDAYIEENEIQLPKDEIIEEQLIYLNLATAGGYHGNYGWFDPFWLRPDGVLLTRCDSSSESRWIIESRTKELITAGRRGKSLVDFRRSFSEVVGM